MLILWAKKGLVLSYTLFATLFPAWIKSLISGSWMTIIMEMTIIVIIFYHPDSRHHDYHPLCHHYEPEDRRSTQPRRGQSSDWKIEVIKLNMILIRWQDNQRMISWRWCSQYEKNLPWVWPPAEKLGIARDSAERRRGCSEFVEGNFKKENMFYCTIFFSFRSDQSKIDFLFAKC